ncbi:MAG: N-acetylmuramoyl-L-alanine amidase [Pseudomonadota bacterium]
MTVEAVPSPNFNDRKHPVDMLVFHYTGMETGQQALDRMCDPEGAVSAHYMIWEDGRIAQLVGEDKRAWHAGVSSWKGEDDLNSRSIGIEIVNGGHDWPLPGDVLPPYPQVQIDALIRLTHSILDRWDIPQTRIVGHSDIAPARKIDPGEHFPWAHLSRAGIGLWPLSLIDQATGAGHATSTSRASSKGPHLIGRGLGRGDDKKAVARLQTMLAGIGYAIDVSGSYDAGTETVVQAFQRRWLQDQVTGHADMRTLRMIGLVHPLYTSGGVSA